MISNEVVSISGASAVVAVLDEADSPVDSDSGMDNVLPSNVMSNDADDCALEESVAATDSLVVNDEDVVDASITGSEDVDSVVCRSVVSTVSDITAVLDVAYRLSLRLEMDEYDTLE